MRQLLAMLALVPLSGCFWMPANRTEAESKNDIVMSGFTAGQGETISFYARDLATDTLVPVGSTPASMSTTIISPVMYPWSKTLNLADNFWAPPDNYNGLNVSAGRVEIRGFASGATQLVSFSPAAQACVLDKMNQGESAVNAGYECTDGTSLVRFDNTGVGSDPELTLWNPLFAPVDDVFNNIPVTWQVGTYTVQGKTIHGLICRPKTAAPYPLQIINHGGNEGLNDAALFYCELAASGGWMAAMSAYRNEQIAVKGQTWGMNGVPELCLGEVTDVLRFTKLIRDLPGEVKQDKVIMWGYSHGACVTTHAVLRGAPVKAAAVFSGPMNFTKWHDDCAMANSGCEMNALDLESTVGGLPSAHPMRYKWRSPLYFKDDLAGRKDVKFLILQGNDDPLIWPNQACELAKAAWGATSQNWYVPTMGSMATQPQKCMTAETSLTWNNGARPANWPGNRYLVVYEGLTHDTIIQIASPAFIDFTSFVLSLGFI